MKTIILFIVAISHCYSISGSQNTVDSLEGVLLTEPSEDVKLGIYAHLADLEENNKPDKAIAYAEKALEIAQSIGEQSYNSRLRNAIGNAYFYKGDFSEARKHYQHDLKSEDSGERATAMGNVGLTYMNTGEYQPALEHFQQALSLYENEKDIEGQASQLNNISTISFYMSQYDKCIEYGEQALVLYEQTGNKVRVSGLLNNLGGISVHLGNNKEAVNYFMQAYAIAEEMGHKSTMAVTLVNIGVIYGQDNRYQKALEFYDRSLDMWKEIGDKSGIATTLNNIGEIYKEQGKYKEAIKFINEGLEIGTQIGDKETVSASYEWLSETYQGMGKAAKALEYHKLYFAINDTLREEASNRDMLELQTEYETEKKEQKIQIQQLENEKLLGDNERQKLTLFTSAGGLLLMVFLAFVLFRSNRIKQRANVLITTQKNEIEHQRDQIAEQKRDLTDSIEYAQSLQQAILPDIESIRKALPEHFIYFRPRDVVSGDFYWFHENDNKTFILAADCTGHGVPGAFVSMLCGNAVNQAVVEKGLEDPGEILGDVNRSVLSVFRKEGAQYKANDGMDCSLCVLDKLKNELRFAGAMNPCIIVRDEEIIELSADRTAIGGNTSANHLFGTKKMELQKDDTIYVFSDGYPDQFGGEKGKKFKVTNFKRMLSRIAHLTINEQRVFIDKTFSNWKNGWEQIDDVLVIGFRV
ncbi:tetratricopeptide repeat protein [Bacteroidales bacterium AH-315-I05]|nr:tetratricopeptide repeat protein [Bacteroidales bacterium AH-315-I05]